MECRETDSPFKNTLLGNCHLLQMCLAVAEKVGRTAW